MREFQNPRYRSRSMLNWNSFRRTLENSIRASFQCDSSGTPLGISSNFLTRSQSGNASKLPSIYENSTQNTLKAFSGIQLKILSNLYLVFMCFLVFFRIYFKALFVFFFFLLDISKKFCTSGFVIVSL